MSYKAWSHVFEIAWLIALIGLIQAFNINDGFLFGFFLFALVVMQASFSSSLRLDEQETILNCLRQLRTKK